MKKYIIFLLLLMVVPISGCTIDYEDYFKKYGNVVNKDEPTDGLVSSKIEDGVLSYPSDNSALISKYNEVYQEVTNQYVVYSSYYSNKWDTLYIAYDKAGDSVQTIDSKDLALIEEHALNYFESDSNKSEYKDYIKVIRIYPDYESSACRVPQDDSYSSIEGCADYNQVDAQINLNGLTNIERFFNPLVVTEGNSSLYYEPKRDTFAHEWGHVFTYYHMILKGNGNYEDYLKLRLKDQYDIIYPTGLLTSYDNSETYYIQPTEIMADDYVDMYYNVSIKKASDVYEYDLEYRDLRNSLTGTLATKDLSDNPSLLDEMKTFYNTYLTRNETEFEKPIIVSINGNVYRTIHDVMGNKLYGQITNKKVIAISEIVINDLTYYKVILSNFININEVGNDLKDYTKNVGYILKEECVLSEGGVHQIAIFNGSPLPSNNYIDLKVDDVALMPYYNFSYFIEGNNNTLKIYNVLDENFETMVISATQFK